MFKFEKILSYIMKVFFNQNSKRIKSLNYISIFGKGYWN